MNKKLLSMALLGAIICSTPNTQNAGFRELTGAMKKSVMILTTAFLGASIFRFYMKDPSTDPVRYSKEELEKAFKAGNINTILQQLWYFYDDGLLGRAGKRPSIRVTPDGKKLDLRPGKMPIGIGGYTHAYFPTLVKTLSFMILVKQFFTKTADGLEAWKDCMGFNSLTID